MNFKKDTMKLLSTRTLVWIVLGILALLIFINYQLLVDFFTIENLKKNNEYLAAYVKDNYLFSVLFYMGIFSLIVAIGLPLIFPLALVGGFLYGVFPGLLYATLSCLIGSVSSFILIRYVISDWMKKLHNERIARFNKQLNKYGYSYLLILHFLSIVPIFVINLLAAVAKIPLKTVAWVTILGTLPLNLLCVIAGKKLSSLHSYKEIFSPTILVLIGILAIIACAPILLRKFKRDFDV